MLYVLLGIVITCFTTVVLLTDTLTVDKDTTLTVFLLFLEELLCHACAHLPTVFFRVLLQPAEAVVLTFTLDDFTAIFWT